jgi:RNase P subunit RPR2
MPCLSREQEKVFLDRLASLSGLHEWTCIFCGRINEYRTSKLVHILPSYKVGEKTLIDPEGPVMPVVVLSCPQCGFINLFSAAIAGTLDESLGVK